MFPECRPLHEEHNAFNKIVAKEPCVIIIVKVVLIGQTILIYFAEFPRVDALRVGHFPQPFEYSVGQNEVADSCHGRVPEKLVDSSPAKVELDAPGR